MHFLVYNLFIHLYWVVIKAFSVFNLKAQQFVEGRKEVLERIAFSALSDYDFRIWIHVSSLGEFEQSRTIIEGLKKRHQNIGILLTFFSPSGYEVRKDYEEVDVVTYLPMDTPGRVEKFLGEVKPDLFIVVKNDFWANYLDWCRQHSVPIIAVSSAFNGDQIYFNRGKKLFLPLFRSIDHFFVQDDRSKELLRKFNINHATTNGDTRIDRVLAVSEGQFSQNVIEQFSDNSRVLIFGSVWPSDIEVMKNVIQNFPDFRYIIAPHDVSSNAIGEISEGLLLPCSLLSKGWSDPENKVLVIDSIGILSKVYRYAEYVYIGGAFQGGVHNTLEALVYGVPVFIGNHPKVVKFKEIADLIPKGGIRLTDPKGENMTNDIRRMDNMRELYEEVSKINEAYIKESAGATSNVISWIEKTYL